MVEKHGYYLEDLSVGMTSIYAKTVTDADVVIFADISGDTNPVHLGWCRPTGRARPHRARFRRH